ncbi:hypothetical protein JOC58_000707 [Paenibacillus hunanensis]|uniref:Uncharacterized protein n=1 Tax=Paenibacillus hunanensis TaxID=539262 RepID=A0ABU1IU79_9BACL|nr:hypothetical protein [Paenibacillus hunanensis]
MREVAFVLWKREMLKHMYTGVNSSVRPAEVEFMNDFF